MTGINSGKLGVALKAGLIASITALAFYEVGEFTDHVPNPFTQTDKYLENVAGHALVGCASAAASGGRCGPAALAGAVTSAAGWFINGKNFALNVASNAVLGGLTAVAGGGKFANGAITGAFGYLFNASGKGPGAGPGDNGPPPDDPPGTIRIPVPPEVAMVFTGLYVLDRLMGIMVNRLFPPTVTLDFSLSRFGEAAEHIQEAIAAGQPDVLTINRPMADANREASTGGLQKVPGKQLDEYPPAMFLEGGADAHVRAINPSDNLSAGAYLGNSLRGYPDGARLQIRVVP